MSLHNLIHRRARTSASSSSRRSRRCSTQPTSSTTTTRSCSTCSSRAAEQLAADLGEEIRLGLPGPTNADYSMHHATRRRYYARTSHAGLDERTPDITVLALCSHHGHGRVDTVASSLVVSYATRLGTTRGVARRRRRALRYGAAVRDSENESESWADLAAAL